MGWLEQKTKGVPNVVFVIAVGFAGCGALYAVGSNIHDEPAAIAESPDAATASTPDVMKATPLVEIAELSKHDGDTIRVCGYVDVTHDAPLDKTKAAYADAYPISLVDRMWDGGDNDIPPHGVMCDYHAARGPGLKRGQRACVEGVLVKGSAVIQPCTLVSGP